MLLRGAQRRGNPDKKAPSLDCFAPLAMTIRRHLMSLRGAQRRGNPDKKAPSLDCFTAFAMTKKLKKSLANQKKALSLPSELRIKTYQKKTKLTLNQH
jgi:hypothetical protein